MRLRPVRSNVDLVFKAGRGESISLAPRLIFPSDLSRRIAPEDARVL